MAPAAVWKQISRWQRAIIGSKIAAEQKRFMIGYNEVSRKYLSIKERLRQAQARFRDEELRIRRKLLPPPPSRNWFSPVFLDLKPPQTRISWMWFGMNSALVDIFLKRKTGLSYLSVSNDLLSFLKFVAAGGGGGRGQT